VSGAESDFELHNLHDLGGIPASGGVIPPGRLFRSANPDALTALGWQQLLDAGIRTIVDLRNDDELMSTVRPGELRVERRPVEDHTDSEFMAVWGDRLGSPEYYYPVVARLWPHLVAGAVSAVADAPPGGILIHCMAGRDRTGMIAAILLELVGVDRNAVFDDFAHSAREINAWWRIHGGPRGSRTDAEMVEYLASARVSLNGFLDDLDAPAYLAAAGITQAQLERLRARLLDA
jgi:protein tyrosine/serine phosphatase